jgi:hypothetical protein
VLGRLLHISIGAAPALMVSASSRFAEFLMFISPHHTSDFLSAPRSGDKNDVDIYGIARVDLCGAA